MLPDTPQTPIPLARGPIVAGVTSRLRACVVLPGGMVTMFSIEATSGRF